MDVLLIIATLLGGAAAIWFFVDRFKSSAGKRGELPEAEPRVDDKLVNSDWWESSSLKTDLESQGFEKFYWSNSDRVPERCQDGYEVIYEEEGNVRYRLVKKDGQVLLGKRGT